jgi:hypothetical protein
MGLRLPLPVAEGRAEYEAYFSFDERHQGGPGLVHGGLVAAALDEAVGRDLGRRRAARGVQGGPPPGAVRALPADAGRPRGSSADPGRLTLGILCHTLAAKA